ncbi:hypothetical protein N656DRAFT_421903 [Canariomyces notabilis]|uniref:Secreted protein n=1 Tax=Canariomyces notabilis TaxID=2074819 RepID=A0AAN6QK10_9PEZI|nr:hypothetical protein N656DRAFT_421903 [Canariomyces arenarius]
MLCTLVVVLINMIRASMMSYPALLVCFCMTSSLPRQCGPLIVSRSFLMSKPRTYLHICATTQALAYIDDLLRLAVPSMAHTFHALNA